MNFGVPPWLRNPPWLNLGENPPEKSWTSAANCREALSAVASVAGKFGHGQTTLLLLYVATEKTQLSEHSLCKAHHEFMFLARNSDESAAKLHDFLKERGVKSCECDMSSWVLGLSGLGKASCISGTQWFYQVEDHWYARNPLVLSCQLHMEVS